MSIKSLLKESALINTARLATDANGNPTGIVNPKGGSLFALLPQAIDGNASVNVNLRTDTLANLLNLAGGVSEIGYATDVDTLVKFNGVAGQAEVYGKQGNGTTLNFTITASNLANITNPASGVYIDCNNVTYLVINIDPAVTSTITNINIKLPNSGNIQSLRVLLPVFGNGINFTGKLAFTLGFQAPDIALGYSYFPISADGTAFIPTFDVSISSPFDFNFNYLSMAGWTRTSLAGEGAAIIGTNSSQPSLIGYTKTATTANVALAVSGTVYNSSSIVINPGIWLLTGSVLFTTTANLDATSIIASVGLSTISTNPTINVISSVAQIQSHLGGGTQYRLAMSPTVLVTDVQVTRYGNALFVAAAGNVGTVSANVYMQAIRLA